MLKIPGQPGGCQAEGAEMRTERKRVVGGIADLMDRAESRRTGAGFRDPETLSRAIAASIKTRSRFRLAPLRKRQYFEPVSVAEAFRQQYGDDDRDALAAVAVWLERRGDGPA